MKQLWVLTLFFVAAMALAQNERSVEEKCQQVVALEAQLRDHLTRYTEQHPSVVATRREIERLRTELRKDSPEDLCRSVR